VVIENTKSDITELAKDLSVASFNIEFVDPVETYMEVSTVFQFNPTLTSLDVSTVEQQVRNTMQSYFATNVGGFNQSFRRSRMLTDIDAVDNSVLSSRADIKMQNRFVPNALAPLQTITYAASISTPLDDAYVIESDVFYYNGKICKLRNKLNSTTIQVIQVSTGNVLVDNIGSYSATDGTISLVNFTGTLITGSYIRVTAVPANPAVINPLRNNVIKYDANASRARAVITDTL
jgi:hypothetical protein